MTECAFCDRIRSREYTGVPRYPVLRFEPLNPVVPGHMLFVPFRHVTDASEDPELTGRVFAAAAQWAQQRPADYNLITSAGPSATQTIAHLHVHYVPRAAADGLSLPWTGQRKSKSGVVLNVDIRNPTIS